VARRQDRCVCWTNLRKRLPLTGCAITPHPLDGPVADGLRVPAAVGDFLILAALRESNGTAVAISDEEMLAASKLMGAWFPCPFSIAG